MNEDKSSRYHRLRRRASVGSVAITAALLLGLLASGAAHGLRDFAVAVTGAGPSSPLTVGVYAVLLLGLHELSTFPLGYYAAFLLERRYGLSSQLLRAWIVDHLKAFTVALLLGVGGALAVYLMMGRSPQWWWLGASGIFIAATILVVKLAPIVLLPMFYRFRPLERDALRRTLLALSERAGVPALSVHVWGLGEKTRRANAALVGSGSTRRILLSDTLLAGFSDDEIEVILAHEIGHHMRHDIPRTIAVESAGLVAAFGAAAAALALLWRPLGLLSPSDVAGLPLLVLAGGVVSSVATPFLNAWSRASESRADRYALDLTGKPAAFISAMRRLAVLNLAEEHPSTMTLWLFHTHPAIEDRIEMAQAWEGSRQAQALSPGA